MPGVQEINNFIRILHEALWGRAGRGGAGLDSPVDGRTVRIMALHGGLSPTEQKRVFQPVRPGGREVKVVVSTNVAEASVTIADVTVVQYHSH